MSILQEAQALTTAEWELVHNQVQAVLQPLQEAVGREFSDVRIQPASVCTHLFPLYSYQSYSWQDEPELEAVLVGVIVQRANGACEVRGDIGGEETGCTYFMTDKRLAPEDLDTILETALQVAAELLQQGESLIQGLRERRKPPQRPYGNEG